MGKDYTINIRWGSGAKTNKLGGGNLSKFFTTQKNASGGTDINIKGFAILGMSFKGAQMANETLGAYTENRLRQRKFNKGLTLSKYAMGIAINPFFGSVYMAQDLAYRSVQYSIGIQKGNREADYYRRLSGNNSNSGSRYRGNYR